MVKQGKEYSEIVSTLNTYFFNHLQPKSQPGAGPRKGSIFRFMFSVGLSESEPRRNRHEEADANKAISG